MDVLIEFCIYWSYIKAFPLSDLWEKRFLFFLIFVDDFAQFCLISGSLTKSAPYLAPQTLPVLLKRFLDPMDLSLTTLQFFSNSFVTSGTTDLFTNFFLSRPGGIPSHSQSGYGLTSITYDFSRWPSLNMSRLGEVNSLFSTLITGVVIDLF